jgi:hypothetical protein
MTRREKDRQIIAERYPWEPRYSYIGEYPSRKQLEAAVRELNRIAREVKRAKKENP